MRLETPWMADTENVLPRFGIDEMPGSEFESLVAELLRLTGFETQVTPTSGDFGADVVAESSSHRISVQAKRYSTGNPVSRDAVSDAIAAQAHYDCDEAMVVTNRGFSSHVAEFAADRCYLIDRTLLAPWLAEHADELHDYLGGWDLEEMPGSSFEEAVGDLLRSRGYTVKEVGGTRDYGTDLVAERNGQRWSIQVKRQNDPVSRRAVSDAVAARDYYDCSDAMVISSAHAFSAGAEQLASDTECRLVGRPLLEEWLDDYRTSFSQPTTSDEHEWSFRSPEQFLRDVDWYRQLTLSELGPLTLGEPELKTSGFLTKKLDAVTTQVTIPYQDVPPRTWLVLRLTAHPRISWRLKHSGTRHGKAVWSIPLREGNGEVVFHLTKEPPAHVSNLEIGVEEAEELVDLIDRQGATVSITLGEPTDSMIADLAQGD